MEVEVPSGGSRLFSKKPARSPPAKNDGQCLFRPPLRPHCCQPPHLISDHAINININIHLLPFVKSFTSHAWPLSLTTLAKSSAAHPQANQHDVDHLPHAASRHPPHTREPRPLSGFSVRSPPAHTSPHRPLLNSVPVPDCDRHPPPQSRVLQRVPAASCLMRSGQCSPYASLLQRDGARRPACTKSCLCLRT